jgi:nondiscriminating aspartyl-tRNA synthetase
MERTLAAELPSRVGQDVRLLGWLHRLRSLSKLTFLILRDASGLAQVVVDDPDVMAQVADVPVESVVEVMGRVEANEQAPTGAEVHGPKVSVVSPAVDTPPFDLYRPVVKASLPTILDHAPVALRHQRLRSGFEIAAASVAGFRRALDERHFVEIQTPKIVASATESGANVFSIDYFGRPAFLAQSPQFYKQIMVGVFERVYEVGPVFRAEPHDTARHLSEYVSLDVELGFVDDHHTVMAVVRDVLVGMVGTVVERAAPAVERLDARLPSVPDRIPEIHFSDAQALISADTGEDLTDEPDLAPAHERWLCDWAEREHGSEFVFVTGFPLAKRPFYTHPDPTRAGSSNGFDLLFRGLELVTGGQRLHRYDDYVAALRSRGEDPDAYAAYLQAFRYGMPPHGGFALGLERWTARVVGAQNIRETTLFPRDLQRLEP